MNRQTRSVFLIGIAVLFLELMLIRWISTEVRIFAYLQNTILVVCFLALGFGCFTARKPFVLRSVVIPLFALVLLLAIPATHELLGRISFWLSVFNDLVIWGPGTTTGLGHMWVRVGVGLMLTLIVMILIWDVFVPIGRLLGRLLEDHPDTIRAYSANVAGSLVGVWLFVLLSVLLQPPFTWVLLAGVLLSFLFVGTGRGRLLDVGLLCSIVLLAWIAGRDPQATKLIWSPYQKLSLKGVTNGGIGRYQIDVNNTGYQILIDPDDRRTASNDLLYPPEMAGRSQYDIPFLLHPDPESALLVGAGSGNDAAGALRHGVKDITAVEIDPGIIQLGRQYHPERPYDSPRVTVVNDDARSFFARTDRRYDVVSFGLLDSHTTTAMTNARLDHYVYTRESLQRARTLLAPGGVMALSFEATKPFIADRMARTLREVFGEPPIIFRVPTSGYGWGGLLFINGDLTRVRDQIHRQPELESLISTWQRAYPVVLTYSTRVITDDWPYLYLERARIPALYFLLAALLVVLVVRGSRDLDVRELARAWHRREWHFFFLGAGFLLLEVQNVSKASVILGNTWWVNAVVISGVLLMVLLANALVAVVPRISMTLVYALLFLVCGALYFVDLARFAFLPPLGKIVVVATLTCLPMVFAGIVFIRSFATTARKDAAIGANLIGSLAGGLMQSMSFVTGIRALLVIVAGLYLLAMLTRPGRLSPAEPSAGRLS